MIEFDAFNKQRKVKGGSSLTSLLLTMKYIAPGIVEAMLIRLTNIDDSCTAPIRVA